MSHVSSPTPPMSHLSNPRNNNFSDNMILSMTPPTFWNLMLNNKMFVFYWLHSGQRLLLQSKVPLLELSLQEGGSEWSPSLIKEWQNMTWGFRAMFINYHVRLILTLPYLPFLCLFLQHLLIHNPAQVSRFPGSYKVIKPLHVNLPKNDCLLF